MSNHPASLGLALAALLTASLPAAADSSANTTATMASAPSEARLKRALQQAVVRHVVETGLEATLRGFSLSPALLQLRSYVDPGEERTKFVCVVGLSLQNSQHEILAEIRGSAATTGSSQLEAIDAAARSAVSQLPGALAGLEARTASREKRERSARR